MNLRTFFQQVEHLKRTVPLYAWDGIQVIIPAHPGYSTLGGTPGVPLASLLRGFDWDAGRVFLQPDAPLNFNGRAYSKKEKGSPDAPLS